MPRAPKEHATRRKDGRFQCTYKGQYFIGPDEEDVLRQRREAKARDELNLHESIKPKSVRTYAAEWLPLHKAGVSQRHYNACANHLDRLSDTLGDMALADVRPDDAARVWKQYTGMSASTIRKAAQLFRAVFDSAIENDFCTKNPFRSKTVTPPRAESGSHRALTEEEISLILTTPHRLQRAVLVMLYAGLRRGEVIALTANDIDLEHGVIRVDKATRYDSNAAILDTPKTAAGVRTVPILKRLRPFLKDIKGYVAPSASGGMMTEQAWQRAWESYLDALTVAANNGLHRRWYGRTKEHKALLAADQELPPYREISFRPHDLRHTYATLLCNAGVPLRQAMEWLGHADEKMILRVYDHIHDSRTSASIKQVEKLLSARKPKAGKVVNLVVS